MDDEWYRFEEALPRKHGVLRNQRAPARLPYDLESNGIILDYAIESLDFTRFARSPNRL